MGSGPANSYYQKGALARQLDEELGTKTVNPYERGFYANRNAYAWRRGYEEWEPEEPYEPKLGDGTPDAALAIAEHAFRAGWDAGWEAVEDAQRGYAGKGVDGAWSEYTPPEDIKALS